MKRVLIKKLPVREKIAAKPVKAKPSREATLTMKAISRRLMQDLATVYNWKNRKKDPLPIVLEQGAMMVSEHELLGWLADNEPALVVTWNATKNMDEAELKKASITMNKADVLLMGIRKLVEEARG